MEKMWTKYVSKAAITNSAILWSYFDDTEYFWRFSFHEKSQSPSSRANQREIRTIFFLSWANSAQFYSQLSATDFCWSAHATLFDFLFLLNFFFVAICTVVRIRFSLFFSHNLFCFSFVFGKCYGKWDERQICIITHSCVKITGERTVLLFFFSFDFWGYVYLLCVCVFSLSLSFVSHSKRLNGRTDG